jgi:hypothetical protein
MRPHAVGFESGYFSGLCYNYVLYSPTGAGGCGDGLGKGGVGSGGSGTGPGGGCPGKGDGDGRGGDGGCSGGNGLGISGPLNFISYKVRTCWRARAYEDIGAIPRRVKVFPGPRPNPHFGLYYLQKELG